MPAGGAAPPTAKPRGWLELTVRDGGLLAGRSIAMVAVGLGPSVSRAEILMRGRTPEGLDFEEVVGEFQTTTHVPMELITGLYRQDGEREIETVCQALSVIGWQREPHSGPWYVRRFWTDKENVFDSLPGEAEAAIAQERPREPLPTPNARSGGLPGCLWIVIGFLVCGAWGLGVVAIAGEWGQSEEGYSAGVAVAAVAGYVVIGAICFWAWRSMRRG